MLWLMDKTCVLLAQQIFQQLTMGNFHEQRVCVKFYFKLGKIFSKTSETLKQVSGDEAFKEG